jgi:hypothetical protein
MRPLKTIALLAFSAFPVVLPGQSTMHQEKGWQQVCESSMATPVEQPAITGSLAVDKLARCDESDLYYGISGKPDYSAAMQCGWYERAHPKPNEADMFYGPGVLTMLYANGQAVPRNYNMAIRFACENEWSAGAEMELRIGHLEALRDGRVEPGRFDLCDDITSGLSMGFCTSIETGRADARREQEIAAVAGRLPESSKATFERLRAAEKAFEDARTRGEIDLSGTARGMFTLEEQKRLRDQFLINLQRFGAGDVPKTSAPDLAALDRVLNSMYHDIQQAPSSQWQYGTVKPEGIRDTERNWVELSDAWVAFAHEAYPNLDGNAVRAQIIRLRLHQLRSLAPRVD